MIVGNLLSRSSIAPRLVVRLQSSPHASENKNGGMGKMMESKDHIHRTVAPRPVIAKY